MATSFSSLPIVDLTPLRSDGSESGSGLDEQKRNSLAKQLHDVFATTGFAYLVNLPLSFDHEAVFGLTKEFFALPNEEKMKLAKKSFRKENTNTYRG